MPLDVTRFIESYRPVVFGYGRMSTDKQQLSVPLQMKKTEAYFVDFQNSGRFGVDPAWGGWYADKAVSASTTPLTERPYGQAMMSRLRPGDHIITDHSDRMFRSLLDLCSNFEKLKEMNISLHIVTFPIDISTAEGEAFFKTMGVFAELFSKMAGRRVRESRAYRREQGLPCGVAPVGWSVKKNGHGKRGFVKDERAVQIAYRAARYYVEHADCNLCETVRWMSDNIREPTGKPRWGEMRVRCLVAAFRHRFPLPNFTTPMKEIDQLYEGWYYRAIEFETVSMQVSKRRAAIAADAAAAITDPDSESRVLLPPSHVVRRAS
jgi:DNA invertase Pin-like site-specific DNA recombinase